LQESWKTTKINGNKWRENIFLSPEGQCLWFSLDMVSIKEKENQNA
jgi:hypothetical protein